MTFQRSCLYHPVYPMRVIEAGDEETYRQMVASGMWFDSPAKARELKDKVILEQKLAKEAAEKAKLNEAESLNQPEVHHEKPIRRGTRQRSIDGEIASSAPRSGT